MSSKSDCRLPNCDCRGHCQAALFKPKPKPVEPRVRSVPPVKRLDLWNGRPCPYCRRTMILDHLHRRPTRDHIDPKALGGPDALYNIAITCSECNHDKGSMTLQQFYVHLLENGDERAQNIVRFIRDNEPKKAFAMTKDELQTALQALSTDAQAQAHQLGLSVAVCVVAIHEDYAMGFTSPFTAEPLQSIAVANRLEAQASAIWDQANGALEAQQEAAE